MPKRGLGRGLEAILGAAAEDDELLREIDVDDIQPNPNQPRMGFAEDKLAELSASIREHGVVQPILVRPSGDRFELIAGERRWRAARMAGLATVPAVVRSVGDREALEIALVENLQREDLTAIEEAKAFRAMVEAMELTQEQIAEKVGLSRPAVANSLRLLSLPTQIQDLVESGAMSASHARTLVGLDHGVQSELVRRIMGGHLTVRDVEELARTLQSGSGGAARPRRLPVDRDPDVVALERRLQEALGTDVRLQPKARGGGELVIKYFSDEDLERVAEALLGEGWVGRS